MEEIKTLKIIFSQKKYWAIFLVVSLAVFFVSYKLTLMTTAYESIKIYSMMSGVGFSFISLLTSLIISLLFGLFFALFIYKIVLIKKTTKTSFFGFIGLIAGMFAAGCPTCGAFLFSLVGAPLALMVFPFHGLELKALSIVLLVISNIFLVRSLNKCERCGVGNTLVLKKNES